MHTGLTNSDYAVESPLGFVTQAARYAVVGVCNTVLGLGLILLAHNLLGLGITLSNVIGYGAGLCISFLLNRAWTFQGTRRRTLASATGFALVTAFAFGVNLALVHGLTGAGLSLEPAQAIAMIAYSTTCFLGLRYAVFPIRN